ncbi:nucleotidyltransferase family protein [Maribacter litopenaei]|uniref:Nucleotidyltransferase family protein n=2 Tax=Maribacter litopenaei TaxID=2976127 RepID=A0ABY5YCY9_9FLAO|nr:nucleotidyltransferase family protein [Maribacter litopenaei]UWX56589.1 nucleotidyltransferase family protein [Maribacter litopenaei]
MAAGQSSRMRGIKQLLPWKGTFLLQHIVNVVKNIQPQKIKMVLGANIEKIKSRLEINEGMVDIIENPTWQNGLGNSIAVGVASILKSNPLPKGILICLADQPLVTEEYLMDLLDNFKTNKVDVVASNYGKRIGVPAVFGPSIYKELLGLNSDYGAKEILRKKSTAMLSLDAYGLLADIDTPSAYEKIYNENHNS